MGRPHTPGVINWVLVKGVVTYWGSRGSEVKGHMTQGERSRDLSSEGSHDTR